jgi:uncharacterized protein (TIGR00661 family)
MDHAGGLLSRSLQATRNRIAKRMRILYGVHGYGRGHATRTLALLPYLAEKHQLLILAGGDAHSAIWPDYPVTRIPTLGFAYGRSSGERCNLQTLRRNLPAALDLILHGPVFDMVQGIVRDFAPDVIMSDAEGWTHHVASACSIPRIAIDHIGILAYCRPFIAWNDRLEACLDTFCYRVLTGQPDRIIVSSFYPAPPRRPGVCVVRTLPRQAVRDLSPTRGDHLLVYFNRADLQLDAAMLEALDSVGCPVHVYGTARRGRHGRLTFCSLSNLPFLEDLACCRAVISTAGNQLMGEAIYLGKPVLVVPERCVEQRLNAAAVERLRIGMSLSRKQFTARRIRAFLDREDTWKASMDRHVCDGLPDALAAIERFLEELAPAARVAIA